MLLQPCLSEPVSTPSAALKDLLHSDDLYMVSAGAALAPYNPLKLRVTRGDLQPKEIESLVSDDARRMIAAPHEYILKSSEDLAREVDAGIRRG